jgi:hypothetical protein
MPIGSRLAHAMLGQAAVLALVLGLGGCADGSSGVEFNGKLFDAVGLTGSLGKKSEEQVEQRAPLILPPPTEQLPQPGALAANAPQPAANPAWPNDPEKSKAQREEALKQAQADYCRDGNWKEKAMRKDVEAAQGPAGPCSSGVFSWVGKSLFGND